MKLDRELSMAIRTIEMMLDKLSAKEEFCVSDIEADLVEWRGALYEATKGNDPLFDEYDVHEVELWNQKYRFKWPNDSYDFIKTLYTSGGYLYATSVSVHDLLLSPDGVSLPNTFSHTNVCLGDIGSNQVSWIEASKTNLKRV